MEGITLPNFKIYYNATIIKTSIGEGIGKQSNGMELGSLEINPYKYGQLIFGKSKKQFNGERLILSTDCARTIIHSYAKVTLN